MHLLIQMNDRSQLRWKSKQKSQNSQLPSTKKGNFIAHTKCKKRICEAVLTVPFARVRKWVLELTIKLIRNEIYLPTFSSVSPLL